jgi:hypothetical protein
MERLKTTTTQKHIGGYGTWGKFHPCRECRGDDNRAAGCMVQIIFSYHSGNAVGALGP